MDKMPFRQLTKEPCSEHSAFQISLTVARLCPGIRVVVVVVQRSAVLCCAIDSSWSTPEISSSGRPKLARSWSRYPFSIYFEYIKSPGSKRGGFGREYTVLDH